MLQAIFSDAKRTGAGAFALLVLAILFVDPSGVGGGAVADADSIRAQAGERAEIVPPTPVPVAARSAAPRPVQNSWFTAGEPDSEGDPPEDVPLAAQPPALPAAPAFEIPPPEPHGPDFPPVLRRRS